MTARVSMDDEGPRATIGEEDGVRQDAEDRRALTAAAEGDTQAFERLIVRHEGRIVALCGRMLGDADAARDAAQEVFFKAFRNAGRYRPRGRVFTWLYRIAVNHCLNRLRRRRIVRFLPFAERAEAGSGSVGPGALVEPTDPGPDPGRRLEARRQWARVQAGIRRLPAGQQAVLVLAKFEGLRYRQIAEVLDITEGAVESRLFRAMRRLEREIAS